MHPKVLERRLCVLKENDYANDCELQAMIIDLESYILTYFPDQSSIKEKLLDLIDEMHEINDRADHSEDEQEISRQKILAISYKILEALQIYAARSTDDIIY